MESPDVEKEFPGLYAEGNLVNDDTEVSRKELKLKKDKKDKKSYATLDDSEDDEKSPSKSKKTKAFKFPSTRSKEKREKSKECKERSVEKEEVKEVKEKDVVDAKPDKKKKEKSKEKDEKKEKVKDKEEKKEKSKDKEDKKDKKKSKQNSITSEEVLSLGDVQPIFGVSLGLAVVRSRCHDLVNLPLVVRDCIDYLQEHGLNSEHLYRTEAVKTKLQQLKKQYNNRDSDNIEFDIPTACSLLKMYLKELPEPILTTDLSTRFEEVASLPQVTQQEQELRQLIEQLPNCNRVLLAWLMLHFQAVTQNEKQNKLNAQNLAVLLSSTIQMSHRLLIAILCHCDSLFEDTKLDKYVPPLTATSPNLPESPEDIAKELKKQESLLAQIHSEMNAGFVTKKREEQLWETQRIITQLKRKLRSFEKKQDSMQKSMEDTIDDVQMDFTLQTKTNSDDESVKTITGLSTESNTDTTAKTTPVFADEATNFREDRKETQEIGTVDKISVLENGMLMLPEDHPEYLNLIRLQIENQELSNWKHQLQSRINQERSEIVRLKRLLTNNNTANNFSETSEVTLGQEDELEHERLIALAENLYKENALLEQKRVMLTKEIFQERKSLLQMEVELGMKQFVH